MPNAGSSETELVAIKKLLILGLINSGVNLSEIGAALGIDRTNVSRMFPKGTFGKKVNGRNGRG
jgi:hypothetical protein